ncbi:hypothetical protein Busp01_39120 [Trinickia caryophylli]|nr:hypothetical protein Busp01_39120 [Trinickia caryophylli]
MTAIMTVHIPTNEAANWCQDSPQSGTQAAEIDHPPGIGTAPIAAMRPASRIVTARPAANNAAQMAATTYGSR